MYGITAAESAESIDEARSKVGLAFTSPDDADAEAVRETSSPPPRLVGEDAEARLDDDDDDEEDELLVWAGENTLGGLVEEHPLRLNRSRTLGGIVCCICRSSSRIAMFKSVILPLTVLSADTTPACEVRPL